MQREACQAIISDGSRHNRHGGTHLNAVDGCKSLRYKSRAQAKTGAYCTRIRRYMSILESLYWNLSCSHAVSWKSSTVSRADNMTYEHAGSQTIMHAEAPHMECLGEVLSVAIR